MLEVLKITLSGLDIKKEEILDKGSSLWDHICSFFLRYIWAPIRDYKFILAGVLAILLICIVILWARKHVPSKGRITDIYDAAGEKRIKKKKRDKNVEIHDLPKEFYKRK